MTNIYKPWDCVICTVDPGRDYGWAISARGKFLFDDGAYEDYEIAAVVNLAAFRAKTLNIPLVFVIERHNHHGRWGDKQFAGTSRNAGVWEHYIKKLGKVGRWTPKILWVDVDTWRKGTYGYSRKPRSAKGDKDYWKKMACSKTPFTVDHNVAEAFLINKFACYWDKIGKLPGIKRIGE